MQSIAPLEGEVTGADEIALRSTALQRLHILMRTCRYGELRDELARAELAGEIAEFYVLDFHAILAMIEGSELASEYLEMAEAVAASPHEVAIVAEHRAAHDLLRGNLAAAAERCVTTLERVCQTEGLWGNLLIALYRLGEVEMVDATLRGFARLDEECIARLVHLLLSEPELREVRARPAFRVLEKRSTERLLDHPYTPCVPPPIKMDPPYARFGATPDLVHAATRSAPGGS